MPDTKRLTALEKRLGTHRKRHEYLAHAALECAKTIRMGQADAINIWAGDSADLFLQHQQAEAQRDADLARAHLTTIEAWAKELCRKIVDLSSTIVMEKARLARSLHDKTAIENRPPKIEPLFKKA